MATEASSNANGVYDTQFNQPAELAANTPSHATSSSQASSTQQNKADPQEIGWYFVEQYYTTLSKTPERIHLFYSKKSQLVTGVEAEKVVPSVGTKAISEKIKALDIQDCKVRVLNVDSQSSFDNIVVQVIGELSNKSQPHHKFVQTFVLATQPNGYFVLNDIFRYLNDEEDEIIEDQPAEQPASVIEPAAEAEEPATTKAAEEVVDTEETAAVVDEKLEEAEDAPVVEEEEKTNGVQSEPPAAEEPAAVVDEPAIQEPVTIPAPEQANEPEPSPETESPPKVAPEVAPETTPETTPDVLAEVAQEQPQAVPAKKTWASLVGTSKPAIPALPATAAAPTQPKSQRPAQTTQPPKAASQVAPSPTTPATQGDEWQTAEHSKKSKGPQAKPAAEGIVHAYIKNVSEKIDARELRRVLETFGELKYFDVSRQRNCAFVEYIDTAGYAAAVAANPHEVNGEPIVVEERRPRPNAYGGNNANFVRGGGNAGRGRGGIQGQGRTNSQGGAFQKEGRGGFQQRGGKSGNVTPKGRGQSQPV